MRIKSPKKQPRSCPQASRPKSLKRSKARADKLAKLERIIAECGSGLVAFSGGVDSTFLLSVARDVLGSRLLAVTAASPVVQPDEVDGARRFAKKLGVAHRIIHTDEVMNEEYCSNPPERCYHCKHLLFSRLIEVARERGLACVMEASNADDTGDYRPGLRAVSELGIRSPLIEAGLTKAEIRAISRERELPTWNKPALACLASRFPYGERITVQKLGQVLEGEEYLLSLGFSSCRLRYYGKLVRIEVPEDEIGRLLEDAMRRKVAAKLKRIGFQYVTVDLEGYRSGSLNETLTQEKRRTGR
ncbi:MAG: ATP-dependent sacrificial sulfur transferase LarE [Candidatus Krumholzibacteria bacterium]|nr:ATP-dependent sacrificial sulfur transferase LarE [Candidatus Krumholzibacteria bacterium]